MARVLAAALSLVILAALPAAVAASPRLPADDTTPVAGAPLPAPPGRTTLLSATRNGGFPNQQSMDPVMTPNGRFVAFSSYASDLVPGDLPNTQNVFVLDRRSGRIEMVPLPADRKPSQRERYVDPTISADGRWVAFTLEDPPLEGSFIERYVLVWDRRRDAPDYIRQDRDWINSYQPSISANGRYVAFTTIHDLDGEDESREDVARWDRQTGRIELVSRSFDGFGISGDANDPSISANGNLVAFASDGGDSVVDEDTGRGFQVYVRNMTAGRTERISAAANGGPAREGQNERVDSLDPAISADGRYVAFSSFAANLTAEGAGGLFRRDRQTDTTVMVSVTPTGAAANGFSAQPSITGDGGMIAWTSTATDLVPETAGGPGIAARGATEVYIRDLAARETVLISVNRANGPGRGRSLEPAIGGGGRYVAFASDSPELVNRDNNKFRDVFLRDLPPLPTIRPDPLDFGASSVDTTGLPLAATLGNAGWSPLTVGSARIVGRDAAQFRLVADGCRGRVLRRAQACTVSVVFRPRAAGRRAATLQVSDNAQGSPRTVGLRGRGVEVPDPELEISPELGKPGIVTIAAGSGFPRNTPVRLRWSEGITSTADPIRTDARGRFEVPVLVFHNDRTGPRQLIAEPVDGAAFPPVEADMLVIKPTVVPPRFDLLRIIDIPLVLVFRG